MRDRELFYKELRENSIQVREVIEQDETYMIRLAEAAATLTWLCEHARERGLLWLNETAESAELSRLVAGKELGFLLSLVCDGTNPDEVESISLKRYFAMNYTGLEGFLYLIYLDIALGFLEDKSPYTLCREILSLMPVQVEKQMDEYLKAFKNEEIDKSEEDWGALFQRSIDANDAIDCYPAALLDYLLENMSDEDLQRLMRDVEFHRLAVAMQKLGEGSYRKIYNNLSQELRADLIKEMEEIGQEDLIYIAESDGIIISVILNLALELEIDVPDDIKNIFCLPQ